MLAPKTFDEEARLTALYRYNILDTPEEAVFDDVTRLITYICQAPIAVVNLIDRDRQWFKSEIGLGVRETPLDNSICAHAILQPGLFIVPDTRLDSRFDDNPLVTGEPGLRFYAGAQLHSSDGLPLGTLCVLDYEPRTLTDAQQDALLTLSRQVMTELELRVANRALREEAERRETMNVRLRRAMQETHHRVKNNLQVISALADLQTSEGDTVPVAAITRIGQHARALAAIHDLLTQETRDHLEADAVSTRAILEKLIPLLGATTGGREVVWQADDFRLPVREGASLALLVSEIVSNAVKHGRGSIAISLCRLPFCSGASGENDLEVGVSAAAEAGGTDGATAVGEMRARLEVCDDGPGFPAGFDPAQAANTGLGLIDATGRYDLHGDVAYTNRAEGGAQVSVTFPVPPVVSAPPLPF